MALPKILCLHGFGQNGTIFNKKTKFIRDEFKNQLEFVYITGSHQLEDNHEYVIAWKEYIKQNSLENQAQNFEPLSCWFKYAENKYIDFGSTMNHFNRVLKEQGPFVGILGFSQGGIFASIITSLLETNHPLIQPSDHPPLKFSILCSSLFPRDPEIQSYYNLPIQTTSLHVFGERDTIVLPEWSRMHVEKYANITLIEHPLGHELPNQTHLKELIVDFIESQLIKLNRYQSHL